MSLFRKLIGTWERSFSRVFMTTVQDKKTKTQLSIIDL